MVDDMHSTGSVHPHRTAHRRHGRRDPRRPGASAAVTALVTGLLLTVPAPGAQAKQPGPWQAPAPVAAVNDPAAAEGCPIESPDAGTLFLVSTRSGGDQDIYVAERRDDGTVGAPEMLPAPVNSDANDFCPTPLRGTSLLFVSNRGGTDAYGTAACGAGDIYVTRLSPSTGTWTAPRNLGCTSAGGPNGPGTEYGPSVVETDEGTFLYFSSGGPLGSGTQDIYVSRADGSGGFGSPTVVASLSSGADDVMPNVRKDGLEVVFASTRLGGRGMFDIWSATRPDTGSPWSTPTNVGTVNTTGSETRPSLSWDGTRLYFGRSGDIFVSRR